MHRLPKSRPRDRTAPDRVSTSRCANLCCNAAAARDHAPGTANTDRAKAEWLGAHAGSGTRRLAPSNNTAIFITGASAARDAAPDRTVSYSASSTCARATIARAVRRSDEEARPIQG